MGKQFMVVSKCEYDAYFQYGAQGITVITTLFKYNNVNQGKFAKNNYAWKYTLKVIG